MLSGELEICKGPGQVGQQNEVKISNGASQGTKDNFLNGLGRIKNYGHGPFVFSWNEF